MLSQVTEPCTLIRIQSWGSPTQAPEPLERLLEVQWPFKAGTSVSGRADVICIAPGDWLLHSAATAEASGLLEALTQSLRGSTFRATDFSRALARIRIDGEEARGLLAKACSLDVSHEAFQPGCAPRTFVAGIPVVIRCVQPSTFECIVALSFVDYLMTWLRDAALEFSASGGWQ